MNTKIEMEVNNNNYFVSVKTDDKDLFERVKAEINGNEKTDCHEVSTTEKKIGDVVLIEMANGSFEEFLIVDRDEEGYTLYAVDCIGEPHCMNSTDTTEGGYDASEMREYLNNQLILTFGKAIRNKLLPMGSNGDLIRLATYNEIFGDDKGNGRWKPMEKRRNRIAMNCDDCTTWYWLSSVYPSTYFCDVRSAGYANASTSSNAYGVRPAIKVNFSDL